MLLHSLFHSLPWLYHDGLSLQDVLIRLLFSGFAGMAIGFNRQIRFQNAGLRTFMLMTLGSTIAMMVSIYMAEVSGHADASRIAAQVLSGVGFLGAGAIIRGRGDNIQGLTTAACIWASSALGLAIGAGMYLSSILFVTVILFTLVILGNFEAKLGLRRRTINMVIHTNIALPDLEEIQSILDKLDVKVGTITIDSHFDEDRGVVFLKAHYKANKVNYKLNSELKKIAYVTAIKTDY